MVFTSEWKNIPTQKDGLAMYALRLPVQQLLHLVGNHQRTTELPHSWRQPPRWHSSYWCWFCPWIPSSRPAPSTWVSEFVSWRTYPTESLPRTSSPLEFHYPRRSPLPRRFRISGALCAKPALSLSRALNFSMLLHLVILGSYCYE
jgi:hypothetical protein